MDGKPKNGKRQQAAKGRAEEKGKEGAKKQSSRFNEALKFVLRWEGGVSDDPADAGGLTNRGVTQKTYDRFRARERKPLRTVVKASLKEVREIYRQGYWNRSRAGSLAPKMDLVHFDTAVNMGPARAQQFLRKARGLPEQQIARYLDEREAFYRRLVERKSSQRKFLRGWLRRVDALRKETGVKRSALKKKKKS